MVSKYESELRAAREELERRGARLAALEAESAVWERLKTDRATQDAGVGRLHSHLLEVARDASVKQHALQNSLHATRQFLEELKVEYEQFSARTRVEQDRLRTAKHQELEALRTQFEAYRKK